MKYTIGITTFEHRFEKYFKPLIKQIKEHRPELEVIVYVNAQYGKDFNDNYRKKLLQYISEYKNIYPIITPHFKGLSKMWNTIVINSSNNKILIFNDDISILPEFFTQIESIIHNNNTSFRINSSFSHFFVERQQIFEVGFFDERLIGLGEEDGDWCFRWEKKYQQYLPIFNTNTLISFSNKKDEELHTDEITPCNGKYVRWNTDWIFKNKYDDKNDSLALTQGFPANSYNSMYGKPVAIRPECEEINFYPTEKFFWEHINELSNLRQ